MNEVSCKVLYLNLAIARERGLALEALVEGTGVEVATIIDSNARIDWGALCNLEARLEELVGGPAELERLAAAFIQAPVLKGLRSVAGLVSSPRLLLWASHRWFGHAMFTIVTSDWAEVDANWVRIRLGIPEPYRDSPQFFRINAGVFRAVPRILDLPDAEVQWEAGPRSATYLIRLPPSMTVAARIKRAWRMVFATQAAFEELGTQQSQIKQQFFQLTAASQTIEQQRASLALVHEIAIATHKSLSLEQVVGIVAREISTRLNYPAVRVSVATTHDDVTLLESATAGDWSAEGLHAHTAELMNRETKLGIITVGRPGAPLSTGEQVLLQLVADNVSLAISNAVQFEVIRSYQRGLEQKVKDRTAELEQARDAIQRTLDSRNRFFANVNHELRTPLSVLLLALDRLNGDTSLSEVAREQVEVLQSNVSRLRDLVDELLLLAAGAEVSRTLRLTEIRAGRMLNDLVESLRPLAEQRGLRLSAQVEPSLLFDGDSRLIERAVANLLTNALKYTSAGEVTLSATSDGAEVVITVKDTGPGIAPEHLPRLFERFFQVPFASSRPGAGIGLAMVKEIAEQHGGQALVDSAYGQGSTFTLRLPRRASDEVRARAEPEVAARWVAPARPSDAPLPASEHAPTSRRQRTPPRGSTPAQATHRLLVVEDNVDLLEQLVSNFAAQGWAVDKYVNAEEALKRAQSHPPDLLITDLDLGAGMNGLQLVKEFSQLRGHRHAPAIVLTANVDFGPSSAFAEGALEYLEKPINPLELIARVKALLAFRDLQLKLMSTERLAAQGAALAGLSHELRNPLNGLINAIEPLRAMLPEDAIAPGTASSELLGVIEECGQRVARLATELLALTRTDATRFEPQPLKDVIERALRACSHKLRPVQLKKELGFDGQVECSPLQLSQVLINLLENAADAAGSGGWVSLKTAQRSGRVELEVRDSGPGVPGAIRDKIFEPFFTTKAAGHGTGLGLAIARDIARRHGGDLELVDDGAFGVRLWLPSRGPAAEARS